MSKADWFRHFEEIDAEHPHLSDEEMCELAQESMIDEMASRADALRDDAKYEPRDES